MSELRLWFIFFERFKRFFCVFFVTVQPCEALLWIEDPPVCTSAVSQRTHLTEWRMLSAWACLSPLQNGAFLRVPSRRRYIQCVWLPFCPFSPPRASGLHICDRVCVSVSHCSCILCKYVTVSRFFSVRTAFVHAQVNTRVHISVCNYSDSQGNCPQSSTTKRILILSGLTVPRNKRGGWVGLEGVSSIKFPWRRPEWLLWHFVAHCDGTTGK